MQDRGQGCTPLQHHRQTLTQALDLTTGMSHDTGLVHRTGQVQQKMRILFDLTATGLDAAHRRPAGLEPEGTGLQRAGLFQLGRPPRTRLDRAMHARPQIVHKVIHPDLVGRPPAAARRHRSLTLHGEGIIVTQIPQGHHRLRKSDPNLADLGHFALRRSLPNRGRLRGPCHQSPQQQRCRGTPTQLPDAVCLGHGDTPSFHMVMIRPEV